MNLMFLAKSGLGSAQAGLSVIGNNLNNALTPGYSRQNLLLGEAGGKTTRFGFFGYGVQVNGVERAYDNFVNNEVRNSTTEFYALSGRYQQVSQIDNMFGDTTNNISIAFGAIFESMQKMSSDPVNTASRQETYAQFNSLSYKFQTNSKTLNGLEKSTNTQINQSVNEINDCARQLANINAEIEKIHGQTGNTPPDLLDQRDRLLDTMSSQVGIRVSEDPKTGRVDVSMANGLSLVHGDRAYGLETRTSPANPNIQEVFYIDASGNAMQLDESKFTTGKLGGLFTFRNEDLVKSRNELDQLALQMANEFNKVNAQGLDAHGNPGGDIYNIPNPTAITNSNNTGDATLAVEYKDITAVNATDYTIVFKGPGDDDWEITTRDGRTLEKDKDFTIGNDGELLFDGVSVKPSGDLAPGDSFLLNPVSGAAAGITMNISDGSEIAACKLKKDEAGNVIGEFEESNNENLLEFLAIKDKKMVNGSTFSEAYASMVSSVGNTTSSLKGDLTTSSKVLEQWAYEKQAVSGVDMNEEFVNLTMFTQYYQANAQVLQTAISIFDTILSIR